VDPLQVKRAQQQLEWMGLPGVAPLPKTVYQVTPDLPHELLPDSERTLKERVEAAVLQQVEPVKKRVNALVGSKVSRFDGASLQVQAGWTRYFEGSTESVPYPGEDCVIDYETMVKFGNWPVMAAAVGGSGAWYIWLHPSLVKSVPFYGVLVPTDPEGRLYFAWNAGFDRSQSAGSYLLENEGDIWLDGMSFHMGSYGLSSAQRKAWDYSKAFAPWAQVASPKSLLEATNLHNPGLLTEAEKEIRDIFVEATSIEMIRRRLTELVQYCANDVYATHRNLKTLWPRFQLDNPSPLSLAGMIQLSRSLLPVIPDWPDWIDEVEKGYEAELNKISTLLKNLALEVAAAGFDPNCPWTSSWDWTLAKTGSNKGQPHWLRSKVLAKGKTLGPRSRLAPALLKLKWQDNPIFHVKEYGWIYFGETGTGTALEVNGKQAWRVPHEKGDDVNVGSPLAKGYIEHYENGLMTSDNEAAKLVLDTAASISYWTSVRERVMSQKAPLINGHRWIVPQLENYGTTTRRAVEPLWLTVSSAKAHKYGTELKGMVRPPEGYVYVAADFTSQELVILAGLADKAVRAHGSSGIGYIVMSGTAADKTDAHSLLQARLNRRIAELRGLSEIELVKLKLALLRGDVKGPNYAIAYGAGVPGLTGFIKQAKPVYTAHESETLASEAIAYMKGRKINGRYQDGMASEGFNDMESVAASRVPKTPALGSAISCGLRQDVVGRDYMTSRCNWRIQSCGRDLLDILVSVADWLFKREPDFWARFMFSYHDEALFMCREGDEKKLAELISVAHLYAWAIFYEAIGMEDVPANLAWFGSINVDRCFRKEVTMSQVTVSNTREVPSGYDIFPDEVFSSSRPTRS